MWSLRVNYQEGQLVKKGDPLVDIDARPYEATLLQAQGLSSETRTCSHSPGWTLSGIKPPGREMPLQSKSLMIRKSW